jgi:hypothetical protein
MFVIEIIIHTKKISKFLIFLIFISGKIDLLSYVMLLLVKSTYVNLL